MRVAVVLAVLLLTTGCGARSDTHEPNADAAAGDAGMARDAGPLRDTSPPPRDAAPAVCTGRDDVGGVSGFIPSGTFDFPYVVAGVEPPGSHSCPRLFIRAGADATFRGDRVEIEVDYEAGDVLPVRRFGRMVVMIGDEIWEEGVPVDITRADGLFDRSLPMDAWRASFTVSHHDATTDLELSGTDVPYCNDFAICI